jgi:phage terminase large subunit
MFNCGPVFHENYKSTADVVINQGGTDSGKTVAIMQLLTLIAATTKPPISDPIITILSESVPNSKKGAYRVFKSIASNNKYVQQAILSWNETDRVITFKNGWFMEFIGATDEQNAKQGKRQYLFVNEANGVPWPIFWQMAKRTRIRTFIDYNPSAPFWAHDKLIGTLPESNDLGATVQLIISDHRHNPFLSEKDHAKTEGIKDPELWKVYARGMTGNLSGLIYPNWKQIPDADFPWDEQKFGALDFGYTNDPTAGSRMCRIANKIFVHELCYTPGITPIQLKQIFTAQGFTGNDPIYCEHDGDMIRQLRTLGLLSIAARKGPGSINAGILKVNEYEVFYTASSKNIDFERKRYMFIKDPVTGKFTNTPVDLDNHHMDEIRMGVYTHYYRAA